MKQKYKYCTDLILMYFLFLNIQFFKYFLFLRATNENITYELRHINLKKKNFAENNNLTQRKIFEYSCKEKNQKTSWDKIVIKLNKYRRKISYLCQDEEFFDSLDKILNFIIDLRNPLLSRKFNRRESDSFIHNNILSLHMESICEKLRQEHIFFTKSSDSKDTLKEYIQQNYLTGRFDQYIFRLYVDENLKFISDVIFRTETLYIIFSNLKNFENYFNNLENEKILNDFVYFIEKLYKCRNYLNEIYEILNNNFFSFFLNNDLESLEQEIIRINNAKNNIMNGLSQYIYNMCNFFKNFKFANNQISILITLIQKEKGFYSDSMNSENVENKFLEKRKKSKKILELQKKLEEEGLSQIFNKIEKKYISGHDNQNDMKIVKKSEKNDFYNYHENTNDLCSNSENIYDYVVEYSDDEKSSICSVISNNSDNHRYKHNETSNFQTYENSDISIVDEIPKSQKNHKINQFKTLLEPKETDFSREEIEYSETNIDQLSENISKISYNSESNNLCEKVHQEFCSGFSEDKNGFEVKKNEKIDIDPTCLMQFCNDQEIGNSHNCIPISHQKSINEYDENERKYSVQNIKNQLRKNGMINI